MRRPSELFCDAAVVFNAALATFGIGLCLLFLLGPMFGMWSW
jgi:hypothetical protein